jgi:hypothetical protein
MSASLALGDLDSVLGRDQGPIHNRAQIFKIILGSSILIQGAMIAIGSIFCSVKIIKLVWTSSSKIALADR